MNAFDDYGSFECGHQWEGESPTLPGPHRCMRNKHNEKYGQHHCCCGAKEDVQR